MLTSNAVNDDRLMHLAIAAGRASDEAAQASRLTEDHWGGLPQSVNRRATIAQRFAEEGRRFGNLGHTPAKTYKGMPPGPSATYKQIQAHEAAIRNHHAAIQWHRHDLEDNVGNNEPLHDLHQSAILAHEKAIDAHSIAAVHAIHHLGMDYNTFQGLRQQIRETPTDPTPRLMYADYLEEHNLPKEALRLRLDPTGHIGRAIATYRRWRGGDDRLEEGRDREHKRAIAASIRANRLGTNEAHFRAARINYKVGQYLAGRPYAAMLNDILPPQRHYELRGYHDQQAERLANERYKQL